MKSVKKPRIIYNDDSCTLRTAPQPHTVETISCALDYLKGTQVDCLCWCVGEQIAYAWPSKVIENVYDLKDKHESSLGCGEVVWENNQDVMYSLHKQGIDYLPFLIQKAHKQKLTFIASFRMNDTHIKSYPNSCISPEFWKTHQHYRIWGATDGKSYYNAALDYSFAEVRNRYKAAIEEVATNYDVDGIELDFTRSPYFFNPSEAWKKRAILTRFVRDIQSLLKKIGKAKKRSLTLILRVACQERQLLTAGIDLRQWIKGKLPDILVVSELSNNLNQNIEPWQSLCRKAGILLYPAVEAGPAYMKADFYSTLIRNEQAPRHDGAGTSITPDDDLLTQRAAAQNLLAQKPDGIYIFNFACRLAERKNIMHTDPGKFHQVTSLLRDMGSLKTLARKDKHYTFYPDLPIYVEANRPRRFHQTIPFAIRGADVRQAKVTIRFRQIAERSPHADGTFEQSSIVKPGLLKYYLNEKEISESKFKKTRDSASRIPSGFLLKDHEIVELQIPGSQLHDGENTLAFEMPKFPHEQDPYVYIYDLTVDVKFGNRK